MSTRRVLLLAFGLALPASQLGHSLAYWLRLGPAAMVAQTGGVHAYYQVTLKASEALLGLGLTLALLLVSALRILTGRGRGATLDRGVSYPLLALFVLSLQLALYIGQETVEFALANQPAPVATILIWGAAGQLPVALLGALALHWLSLRISEAVHELRLAVARLRRSRFPIAVAPGPPQAAPSALLRLTQIAPAAVAKRAPPLN